VGECPLSGVKRTLTRRSATAALRSGQLFSDPSLSSKARFSCCVDGPTEFEVLFESIIDEQFGYNPNSQYKRWVRRLYDLGFISRIPDDWQA
jgi:hypothetical protein